MNISFYVLSESKAQNFLGFICQLTQTAINKSTQSVLILVEDETLLSTLDDALWAQEATSFIPHQRLLGAHTEAADPDITDTHKTLAPVVLGSHMPAGFRGIVLNTTVQPVTSVMAAATNAQPNRVLELIKPDPNSVQEGRHKYKVYQQLDYELTHFKV